MIHECPTVVDWDTILEAKYSNRMNGFRAKIRRDLVEQKYIRNVLRKLLGHT